MGKDHKPAGEDNDFFDDVDDEAVEAENKEDSQIQPETEEESESNEDKFFSPEPDEKNGSAELDNFFDDSEGGKPLLSEEFEESEEEKLRKKKAKKRAVVISACSVFVVAVCVFAFVFINQYANRFIMTVNGKKISVEEYKLFYYSSQDAEDVKNSALEDLKQLIAIENLAKARNISMTEEERAEAASTAQSVRESFTSAGYDMPDITDERLTEIMGAFNSIYLKLYDSMTAGYTVDDSDFEEQYEDYVTNYKAYYIEAEYQYIMTETEENAQKVKESLESGADINEVMAEYALDYTEGDEVPKIGIYEVSSYFTAEDTEHLLSLSVGQISDIIVFNGVYYMVFVTESMNIPTEDERRASFTEIYYDNKKYDMFFEELGTFQNESDTKVNQKLLDTFS